MRLILTGSRNIDNYEMLSNAVDNSGFKNEITEIVCAGARGVDILAYRYAITNSIPVKIFVTKWKREDGTYDEDAEYKKNIAMAKYADAIIAIIQNPRDCKHLLKEAKQKKLKIYVEKNAMRIIVAGSRTIENYDLVCNSIENSGFKNKMSEIVSGHARGVDILGERYAKENSIPLKIFPAKWKDENGKLDRGAGYKRNIQMAEYADGLIVIIQNQSRGSEHMLSEAKKRKLDTYVVRI